MDLRRLRAGEWIAGISGLALLVALFLPWYGDDAGSRTGWESLGALDVVLAVVALAALAIPVVTAVQRVPALPLAHQSLTALVGLLALVLGPDPRAEPARLGGSSASGGCGSRWPPRSASWPAGCSPCATSVLTRGGRHTDLTGVPVAAQPRDRDAPAAAPRGRVVTFARLRPADWVVFVAALALLFTTAPDWYSTTRGEEARQIQKHAGSGERPGGARGRARTPGRSRRRRSATRGRRTA